MKKVNHCVCCGSTNVEISSSLMYPFIIERMTGVKGGTEMVDCGYIRCLDCQFGCSQTRFSFEEEMRYYQNYMKEEYINHRCEVEGEGFRGIAGHYVTEGWIKSRKNAVVVILGKVLDFSTVTSVLDFGGDTGKMIPDEFSHAKRFVTDVQVRALDDGVLSVTDPSESGLVDVVICGHTLEHVSDPRAVLENLKHYLKPGGWLYLEVPAGEGSAVIHEHINQFNETSLRKLLENAGFSNLEFAGVSHPGWCGSAQAIIGTLG